MEETITAPTHPLLFLVAASQSVPSRINSRRMVIPIPWSSCLEIKEELYQFIMFTFCVTVLGQTSQALPLVHARLINPRELV